LHYDRGTTWFPERVEKDSDVETQGQQPSKREGAMKNQRTSRGFSRIVEFFRDTIALIGVLTFSRRLAPVPVPLRPRSVSGTTRRIPPRGHTGWLPLLVGFVLLAAIPAWAGEPALPAGVPNMSDPEVRAHFQEVGMGNLRGNPDFPVILVVNTTGEQPQGLLLGLDARNGKATWSLNTDPIILIVVFSDDTTIQGVYVDVGIAAEGKASGTYAAVNEANSPALPGLLKAVTEAATRTYI
jgi:hypothetical protein